MLPDSPILLSFPHFYLANDSYRQAVEGISPPDPEKHRFFIDVQPVSRFFHFFQWFLNLIFQLMGTAMRAKARIQINLAVSQVVDIKQVATFPDIVFPIMWFEEVEYFHFLQFSALVPHNSITSWPWEAYSRRVLGEIRSFLQKCQLLQNEHPPYHYYRAEYMQKPFFVYFIQFQKNHIFAHVWRFFQVCGKITCNS